MWSAETYGEILERAGKVHIVERRPGRVKVRVLTQYAPQWIFKESNRGSSIFVTLAAIDRITRRKRKFEYADLRQALHGRITPAAALQTISRWLLDRVLLRDETGIYTLTPLGRDFVRGFADAA